METFISSDYLYILTESGNNKNKTQKSQGRSLYRGILHSFDRRKPDRQGFKLGEGWKRTKSKID